MNQLINEKSPYLLQHAYNPIQWFPWDKKAFDKAKKENKPIFLSIGYSSCHWCHVMAKESFEDEEVARILNDSYVAIKVDKEERPDIDEIYMGVCMALNGSGGWPLTIIMTPEQKPFFAGTYLPKENRGHGVGLLYLLKLLSKRWNDNNDEILKVANRIINYFNNFQYEDKMIPLSSEWFDEVMRNYERIYDKENGGFIGAPKFPLYNTILFWLQISPKGIAMAEHTLLKMASSCLYDQIEGGFFRYATDEKWLVPHFEKMLYDNALAIIVYSKASIVSTNKNNQAIFKRIALETYNFLKIRFLNPEQGFYSSSSADINGEEGAYYLWDLDEIKQNFPNYKKVINDLNLDALIINDKALPHLKENMINKKGYDEKVLKALSDYRNFRMSLPLDKKIITSWNALMVVALISLSEISNQKSHNEMIKIAFDILSFIEERIINHYGRLGSCYIDGKVSGDGFLNDYTYLAYAYLKIYEKTIQAEYLEKCQQTLDLIIEYFFDHDEGGFYLTSPSSELFYRPKEINDTSIPSSNAILLYIINKIRLLIPNGYYENIYYLQLNFMKKALYDVPLTSSFALKAFDDEIKGSSLLVYVTTQLHYQKIIKQIKKLNKDITLLIISKSNLAILLRLSNYDQFYPLKNNLPTFYLCANKQCYPPVNDLNNVVKDLSIN